MKHTTTALIITLLMFAGSSNAQYCTNNARYTEVAFFDSAQISMGANVQFGTALDHLGNSYALRMDLYYPNLNADPSPKRPFILLMHGGGFVSGDKQSGDIKDLCIHLARRGFVCATMNYRIGHDFSEYGEYKARYRAIQDGHAAMRYVVQSAATLRIDTSWLFVGGQSAGSLTALGMVYAEQQELDSLSLLYNQVPVSVQLGGLYASGNAFTNTYTIKGVFNNWGGIVQSEVDTREMVPTIAFHGAQDTVVMIDEDHSFTHYTLEGSRAIHQQLVAAGKCSELTVDTTGGHGIYRNASAEFRAQRASCFFKRGFCNTCSNLYTTDSIPSDCSLSTGTGEVEAGAAIQVYPNPFENTFSIKGVKGPMQVMVYNAFGQTVYTNTACNGTVQVDLLPGIYFLSIRNPQSDSIFSATLVKH